MLLGHAAVIAAALAIVEGAGVHRVRIDALQR